MAPLLRLGSEDWEIDEKRPTEVNGCWGWAVQLNICGDFSLIFNNERRIRKTNKRL